MSLILTTHLLILHAWSDAVMSYYLTDLYLNFKSYTLVLHQVYYSVGKAVTQVNFDKIIDRISLVIYEHIFSLSLRLGAVVSVCYQWVAINGKGFH